MSLLRVILAIIFPPLSVLDCGCGSILIVTILTLCGWVPGIIADLIILNKNNLTMKTITVSAAIIRDSQNRIFATQRGGGDWKDWWEFPGGKIEPGETPEQALKREIWEELETRIVVEQFLQTVEWDYPKFHLTMHCYFCRVESGSLTLKEHEAARWLASDELDSVQWLPADWEVIARLKELL